MSAYYIACLMLLDEEVSKDPFPEMEYETETDWADFKEFGERWNNFLWNHTEELQAPGDDIPGVVRNSEMITNEAKIEELEGLLKRMNSKEQQFPEVREKIETFLAKEKETLQKLQNAV